MGVNYTRNKAASNWNGISIEIGILFIFLFGCNLKSEKSFDENAIYSTRETTITSNRKDTVYKTPDNYDIIFEGLKLNIGKKSWNRAIANLRLQGALYKIEELNGGGILKVNHCNCGEYVGYIQNRNHPDSSDISIYASFRNNFFVKNDTVIAFINDNELDDLIVSYITFNFDNPTIKLWDEWKNHVLEKYPDLHFVSGYNTIPLTYLNEVSRSVRMADHRVDSIIFEYNPELKNESNIAYQQYINRIYPFKKTFYLLLRNNHIDVLFTFSISQSLKLDHSYDVIYEYKPNYNFKIEFHTVNSQTSTLYLSDDEKKIIESLKKDSLERLLIQKALN